MATPAIAHTGIVSRDQWLIERKKLLAQEKELTKHYDRVNAERRRLPMVKPGFAARADFDHATFNFEYSL